MYIVHAHTCTSYAPCDYTQDLYLDRLTGQIAGLEEQLDLCDAQYSAQCQETKTVKESLTEASMELEVHVHMMHTVHIEM